MKKVSITLSVLVLLLLIPITSAFNFGEKITGNIFNFTVDGSEVLHNALSDLNTGNYIHLTSSQYDDIGYLKDWGTDIGNANTSLKDYADNIFYLKSNPYNYYNITTAPIYINDTFGSNYSGYLNTKTYSEYWNANYSTYLTKPTWAQVMNGTMATAASVNTANTSMKNYVDANFYLKSNPYGYYNSTTLSSAETDPKWSANYSDYLNTKKYAGYWNANYSTYLTKPTWAQVMNGTVAITSTINSFTANQTLNNNYITNGTGGAYIQHNGTGWVIKG